MPSQRMSIDGRFNYLAILYDRYIVADRKERSRLLDEMVQVTGLALNTSEVCGEVDRTDGVSRDTGFAVAADVNGQAGGGL